MVVTRKPLSELDEHDILPGEPWRLVLDSLATFSRVTPERFTLKNSFGRDLLTSSLRSKPEAVKLFREIQGVAESRCTALAFVERDRDRSELALRLQKEGFDVYG
jgi:hypothetical protein